MIVVVKYQIATYSGEITIHCDENDDREQIIAKAKTRLKNKSGSFPIAPYYESWKIEKVIEDDN